MDTEEEEKARKDLEELENRNVHPLAALAFGVVFVVFICGSTTYLRTHLQLPAQDFATAGLLASKDFVLGTLIVSLFEILTKNKRHPIRYGFTFGTMFFVVTFCYWAFFSK